MEGHAKQRTRDSAEIAAGMSLSSLWLATTEKRIGAVRVRWQRIKGQAVLFPPQFTGEETEAGKRKFRTTL